MKTFVKTIKEVIGDKFKLLYFPIALSCVDSILHMGMLGTMIATILKLVENSFTKQDLIMYSIVVIVLFIIRTVVYSIDFTQTQFRAADIVASMRLSLGDYIRGLNLGYFNKNSIGQLMSTLTTDIADFEQMLAHSVASIFKVIFFSILAIIFSFTFSVKFALVIIMLIVIAFPFVIIGGKMSSKYGGKQRTSVNDVVSRVVEYINGIKTFKLYNCIGENFNRMDNSFARLKKDSLKLELSIMPFAIIFSIITSLILPISLVLGTMIFTENTNNVQGFIAVIMIAVSLSNMMATLGTLYPEMKYLKKSAENILRVRSEKPLAYKENCQKPKTFGVSFEDVGFSYETGTEVLHNISFETKAGTMTALVGPSGSGKTTIISLISRFWDVNKGNIKIGGCDLSELSPDIITSFIAVVFQDVYLLNDTIANNIRVGKPNATLEEIQAVAKAAQCHDFISEFPDGYNTVIGEGGNTLSGGEKQRISIARALIKDAPIILLDETTSNLDADNEKEIHKALDSLMKDKTVFVIAHRLNTVVNAEQIIVLDKGVIKEKGSHSELLQQNGWYARMIIEQEKARKWVV